SPAGGRGSAPRGDQGQATVAHTLPPSRDRADWLGFLESLTDFIQLAPAGESRGTSGGPWRAGPGAGCSWGEGRAERPCPAGWNLRRIRRADPEESHMADNLPLRIQHDEVQSLKRALEEPWQTAHRQAMRAWDWEFIVSKCLLFPDSM